MTNWKWKLGFLVMFLCGESAFCGALFAPFGLDSANVMPAGVRSVRLGGFSTELSEKYDGSGQIVPLAQAFNKPVTWQMLIDSQPKGFELDQFKGGLRSYGVDFNDVVGDSRGMVNTRLTTTLPVLAYGLTDKVTVGVAIPVLYSNVSVSTGWASNEAFQAKLDELSQKGLLNKVLSYRQKLLNVVTTKIAGYGYKPLENESHTGLGDVTLALKYQAYKDARFAVAFAPKIVVPTGRTADPDKVVDVAAGDGQWDIGVGGVVDYSPTARLTTTVSASYTRQLAATKAKRLPTSRDETLSADRDDQVREKLGDIMGANMGVRYQAHELWTIGAGYGLQYKTADAYSGSKYESDRYDLLSVDTDQSMQSAIVGMTYSTIPLFKAQKFPLPMDASINYSTVFAGHNVNKISLTAIELVAYF